MGLLLSFLIGVATGSRSMIGIAAIAWAVPRITLSGTFLAFLQYPLAPYIAGILALGELVVDKLPKTPSRKLPGPFLARIVLGAVCGFAIGHQFQSPVTGSMAGAVGAVTGTLGGYQLRMRLARAFRRDFPAALLEDAMAIAIAAAVAIACVP